MAYEKIMHFVIYKALRSVKQNKKAKFAACVVKGSRIISLGYNTTSIDHDIVAHAEINAIRSASKKLGLEHHGSLLGFTLYSTCEPCSMCFAASKYAGIKKIVYGISLNDLSKLDAGKKLRPRKQHSYMKDEIEMVGGVLRQECCDLFSRFH
ncbi:MAG: nucleoside deaminase [Candidatus Marsarchaeota archaeon]|nr:nucleoside deaminase [Candidatus Marsarchaeota archaeon]MCL5419181.1 nucleoside deaminase [Candidatus Marsarchaeota archaeon]